MYHTRNIVMLIVVPLDAEYRFRYCNAWVKVHGKRSIEFSKVLLRFKS